MVREAMNFAQKMTNERTQEAAKQTNPPCLNLSFYIILVMLSLYRSFYKAQIFMFLL